MIARAEMVDYARTTARDPSPWQPPLRMTPLIIGDRRTP